MSCSLEPKHPYRHTCNKAPYPGPDFMIPFGSVGEEDRPGAAIAALAARVLRAALILGVPFVLAGCGDGTAPGDGEPRLLRARFAAADPPPEGENYTAQVSMEGGSIAADVLLRADPACNTIGAGLEVADTLLLVIETTLRSGCEPLSGGTLLEAIIVGVPEDAPPFRIEWWHGEVVDTVWGEQDG